MMIETSHLLRKAYIEALTGLSLNGQAIPVNEHFLTSAPAILSYGNSTNLEAYVIIDNQTDSFASLKCGINEDSQIQLDVVTVFKSTQGGTLQAELISNEILKTLFPVKNIELPQQAGITIWRGWVEAKRTIEQETGTSRIFRRKIILNHSISQ